MQSKNNMNWYSGIYVIFLLVSIILFIISWTVNAVSSINSLISGFVFYITGIFMILISKLQENITFLEIFPILCILGLVVFILYIIIQYKNDIIIGHISSGYSIFINISIIILFIQIWLMRPNNSLSLKISTSIISILNLFKFNFYNLNT